MALKELIETIAKALVDDPEAVEVTEIEGEHNLLIELRVAKDDVGKVIGREGRTAQSMRTILTHQLLSERRFFAQFIGTREPPVEELLPAGDKPPAAAYLGKYVALAKLRLPQLAEAPAAWWLEEVPFFGGNYSVSWSNQRVASSDALATRNPLYTTGLVASYVQPILRGFKTDNLRQQLAISIVNRDISE